MATTSARMSYTASPSHSAYQRATPTGETSYNGTVFASPTDSEFSEGPENQEEVTTWDDDQVARWLQDINAEAYVALFHDHNITGDSLLDLDQAALKEIGVKKIGDRVRIANQIKRFSQIEYRRRRTIHQDSRTVNVPLHTPPSSGSPVPPRSARSTPSARNEASTSRPWTGGDGQYGNTDQYASRKPTSTPVSPQYSEATDRGGRTPRYSGKSPGEFIVGNYFHTSLASESLALRSNHTRVISSGPDQYALLGGKLPADKSLVRVIYDSGSSSVFSAENCRSAEDLVMKALQKGKLNEAQVKNHCFYILDGVDADINRCRRLPDAEVIRIAGDNSRVERERLMLRKIHAGEPDGEQLMTAANIAVQQLQQSQTAAASGSPARSQAKIQKLTGEALPTLTYPMSPASVADRERHLYSAAQDLERGPQAQAVPRARPARVQEFSGGRPPSELVCADFITYFPDVNKDEIEKTVRNSIRRSQRLSRATNRLSIASAFSTASRMYDAPPIPTIADAWLNGANVPLRFRPFSIAPRLNVPSMSYRDSMASGLEPLEESPLEPNRQSYVSFGADSAPDSACASITDIDSQTLQRSYSDDAVSISPSYTEGVEKLNEQLSQAIAEDGEDPDTELTEFLNADSWENVKYLRGKLIGQGSFGSVYLALHAMTGELMAVKQVELPNSASTANNPALDAKKNTMVEALKREIALLKDLKHPNIVQYFGSSTESSTLNIFLEYIPGGSIAKMLVDYGPFREQLIKTFVQQILVGLAYLHKNDIIHRDIKGANVLVDNHGHVKISDFGISKRVQDSKSLLATESGTSGSGSRRGAAGLLGASNRVSLQGSVFWMAPEVVRQTAYTRKADIWSLGCLIVEMMTGERPHPNCSQLQAIFKIGGKSTADPAPEIPASVSPDLREFLQATFAVEFERRPEAEELLAKSFLNSRPDGLLVG